MATNTPQAFIDHGVGAPVAESRGVIAARDGNGRAIVLALSMDLSPRGWILLTDIDAGDTEQVPFPQGVANSPPFASLLSRNGRFYTFAGRTFLEFDLTGRRWLFHGVPAPSESACTGDAMVDGPDGRIYAGTHPNCRLVSFDPETKELADRGQLDTEEHYVNHLVCDTSGWLYAGIGTARQNIVAHDPGTGERVQIVNEKDRVLGTARVYLGEDGAAYGRAGDAWYRMLAGKATAITEGDAAPARPTGAIGWGSKQGTLLDGPRLVQYNLPERRMEIECPGTGEVRRITFDYTSEGAGITSLVAGPDGRIYASTCHPMHFVAYDAERDRLEDWGPVPRVGEGNYCAMAVQGPYVFGAAYSGAWFYQYDTRRPWNNETGDDPNPRLVARFEGDIARPRACLAHPDGRHALMSGFAGYGMCGGGLGIYDLETGRTSLITHEDVVPYQSTITLKALPDGDLIGGTSVSTPGGGHPQAEEGVLYVMDWATREVIFQTAPVSGAPEVFSIEVGPDGLVYGLTTGSQFFVFDPATRKVVHREDMSEYGGLPRCTLTNGPDGDLYAAFAKAIVRIEPGTFDHERLATPPQPITAGTVIHRGRLYFASQSHLWSYRLSPD